MFISKTRTVPEELLSLAKEDLFLKNPYYKNPYLNIMAKIPEERCSIIKKIVK